MNIATGVGLSAGVFAGNLLVHGLVFDNWGKGFVIGTIAALLALGCYAALLKYTNES
jgi:hypothetical protein